MGMLSKSGKRIRFVATKPIRFKGFRQVINICENPPKATPDLIRLMARVKASKSNAA